MRSSLAFALFGLAAACGGSSSGDDVVTPPDSNDTLPPPPDRGFRIESPDITIMPGQEITYCYYFHTPNTETLAVSQWQSVLTPGSVHRIMFQTPGGDSQPEGTVSDQNCGLGASGTSAPIWTYATQTEESELLLPTDDGAGQPLAQEIKPGTPAFFQMHYLNATDQPLTAHVVVDAFALDAGAAYTSTSPYVTYNGNINIPAGATNFVVSQSCDTPANSKFWLMTTHSHKQSIGTRVLDGSNEVVVSTDWEHPTVAEMSSPFYSFTTGKLTYECTYNNPGNTPIQDGESAATDEMCMASGYFFPATKPVFCYNNFILPF